MGKVKRPQKKELGRRGPKIPYRATVRVLSEGFTEGDYAQQKVFGEVMLPDGRVRVARVVERPHPGRTEPAQLVKDMRDHLKKHPLRKGDEAWILADVDARDLGTFKPLFDWAAESPRHHVAVSSPCFEAFLVAHFEEPRAFQSPKQAVDRLRRYIPSYDKRLTRSQFSAEQVQDAIARMKGRRVGASGGLPAPGLSQAWELAEMLLGPGSERG